MVRARLAQGWNDVGFHNPEIKSPHIDELAASGIELTDYHVYRVCSPTRASVMTGRLPNRAGLHNFISHDTPAAISKHFVMMPQALKAAGYLTHYVVQQPQQLLLHSLHCVVRCPAVR